MPDTGLLNAPLAGTGGLRLVPLIAAHAAALYPGLCDPALYTYVSGGPPESLDALQARYRAYERRLSPDGREVWLNWLLERPDGRPAGRLDVSLPGDGDILVGYMVLTAHRGQGVASAAVMAAVAHLSALNAGRRFVGLVTDGNLASMRVLEKAGFRRTRILKDNDTVRGVRVDDVEFVRPCPGPE